jgi:hypothetical protein
VGSMVNLVGRINITMGVHLWHALHYDYIMASSGGL